MVMDGPADQDVDLRCVRMTALNLAFRNLYGYVVWGDSLRAEQRRIFRTGFNGRGFIAEVEPQKVPEQAREVIEEKLPAARTQMSLF